MIVVNVPYVLQEMAATRPMIKPAFLFVIVIAKNTYFLFRLF